MKIWYLFRYVENENDTQKQESKHILIILDLFLERFLKFLFITPSIHILNLVIYYQNLN